MKVGYPVVMSFVYCLNSSHMCGKDKYVTYKPHLDVSHDLQLTRNAEYFISFRQ